MTVEPSNKHKRRRTDWSVTDLFLECGLMGQGHSSIANERNVLLTRQSVAVGLGYVLDVGCTPNSFAHSLFGLLQELSSVNRKNDDDSDHDDNTTGDEGVIAELEEKIEEGLEKLLKSRASLICALLPLSNSSSKHLQRDDNLKDDKNQSSNDDGHLNDAENCNPSSSNAEEMETAYDVSLVKVLLRLERMQTSILKILLQKLPELMLVDNDDDGDGDIGSGHLAKMILSHIRWMDQIIVNPSVIVDTALQCLSLFVQQDLGEGSNSEVRALQLDLIALMPDILGNCAPQHDGSDDQKTLVVDALREIRSDDPTLLIPCLDALSNMQLTSCQLEETIKDTLLALQSADCSDLPAIVRFLVHHVPSSSSSTLCIETMEALRFMRLGEDNSKANNGNHGAKASESTSEALMLEALSQGLQYRSDLAETLLSLIQKSNENGTADVWLLLCCGSSPHNRKRVHSIFRQKASSGLLSTYMLKDAIVDNGASLSFLFHSSIIGLCDALVRAPEKLAREIGSLAYFLLFFEYTDPIQRQEIIGALVTHVGSGAELEVDTALEILTSLTNETIRSTGGSESLRPFAPFLLSLLDYIPQMSTTQIRQLFLILFLIGDISSSGSSGGFDEVQIVIRKYLSQNNFSMKRIGVIGSVSFAVSCSVMYSRVLQNNNDSINDDDRKSYVQEIISYLKLAHKSCEPKNAMMHFARRETSPAHGSALSFFFDEMALAVRGGTLLPDIKEWILITFQDMLEYGYMGEFVENTKNREVQDINDKQLLEGSSTNSIAPLAEMRFDIDNDEAVIYLKILSLVCSNDILKRSMPQYLSSLLLLLSSCNDERYGGEGVEEIDAILGCPIFLPAKNVLGIEFEDMSESKRVSSTYSLFYASCWCRELINTFVASAAKSKGGSSNEIRSKIVQRLQNLVELEEELRFTAKKTCSFAPPGCTILSRPKEIVQLNCASECVKFHTVDNESVQDENCVNNSQKQHDKIDKKSVQEARKLTAKCEKNKMKMMKLQRKYETDLSTRAYDALRPLSYESVLAVGFPELSVVQQATDSEVLSVGISQLKMTEIGGNVVCLLFERLLESLRDILTCSPSARQIALQKFRRSVSSSSSDEYTFESFLVGQNPYDFHPTKANIRNLKYSVIEQYLEGNVFVAVFEHLAAFAETGYSEETDLVVRKNHFRCLRLLFESLRVLSSSIDLSSTKEGLKILGKVLFQLSEGERKVSERSFDHSSMIKSLGVIFDLVEEIISGFSCNGDLDFVLDGVNCLEELIFCARRLDSRSDKGNTYHQKHAPFCTSNKMISVLCKKLSTLSHSLLQRRWDAKFTKSNVGRLLKLYIDSSYTPYALSSEEGNVLNSSIGMGHTNAITHLIQDAVCELQHTPNCRGPVETFPTLSSQSFSYYFSVTLECLSRELELLFESSLVKRNEGFSSKELIAVLSVLKSLVKSLLSLFEIVKKNPVLVKSQCLVIQLKVGVKFLNTFTSKVVPFLQVHFEGHEQMVLDIISILQTSNRIITTVIAHGRRNKDPALIKESPKAKKALESFIHKIKAMMKKNRCLSAYWGGNLLERNIDGSLYRDDESSDDDDETIEDACIREKDNNSEEDSDERVDLIEAVL